MLDLRHVYGWWLRPFASLAARPQRLLQGGRLYVETLRHGRFLASCPRAGTNYLYALLSAADDAARRDGYPQYEYVQQKYSERGRWLFEHENRIPNNLLHLKRALVDGEFDCLSERYFVLSHYPAVRSDTLFPPSWMRPVVVIRHPLHAAESLFWFHYDDCNETSQLLFLYKEINHIVRFF